MIEVNLLGVLIAALASTLLGIIWYSPALFGKHWMKWSEMEIDLLDAERERTMTQAYTLNFFTQVVIAYVFAELFKLIHITTFTGALSIVLFVWIGFVLTTSLGSIIWEEKSTRLFILHNIYNVLSFLLMAIIILFI